MLNATWREGEREGGREKSPASQPSLEKVGLPLLPSPQKVN